MTRPRGFANWRPQERTLVKVEGIQSVLTEYADYLPLTLRQIFYRLVGTEVIGKTEKDYGNLGECLNRARRARIIPMDAVRDDGFSGGLQIEGGWRDTVEYVDHLLADARQYVKDRQAEQPERLVVWCEASGMVPQIERVAHRYGVTVKSSGGFDSTTSRHAIAEYWGSGEMVRALHVGDYDPSGECMFDALREDAEAFADCYGNDLRFERIAITPEQIERYDLPTAPPKPSTHQTRKKMTETVQVEAMSPSQLAEVVEQAITSRMDMGTYRDVLDVEKHERGRLIEQVRGIVR